MKYNALLLRKYEPTPTSTGGMRFAGKFILVNENMQPTEVTAAQFSNPIPVEVGAEIILDINKNGIYYNILAKTSYLPAPFPGEKDEYYYETTLDEKGHDKDGKFCISKHPFAHVKIKQTRYIFSKPYRRTLTTLYTVTEIDDADITRPKILNSCPIINLSDEAASNQMQLIESLRDYLPEEEHPDKAEYTTTDIFKYYREAIELRRSESFHHFQYRSDRNHCICGHYIEELCYCEYMSPLGDKGIKKIPLGAIRNCCIKKMAYDTRLYTRLLNDISYNYKCGVFKSIRDISMKNGFGKTQMQFLKQCVLTKEEYEWLTYIVNLRVKTTLDITIKRILYKIYRFYMTYYDHVFDEVT
jgi:hypothetical protein